MIETEHSLLVERKPDSIVTDDGHRNTNIREYPFIERRAQTALNQSHSQLRDPKSLADHHGCPYTKYQGYFMHFAPSAFGCEAEGA